MTVVLMTDLEGISGVNDPKQIWDEHSAGNQLARERLMADTNAAVDGVIAGGATTVFVVDGHGAGKNFIPDALDPRAQQLSVSEWQNKMRSGTVDAFLEIGAHAMAGTQNGFFDHTQSSKSWFCYSVNGRPSGEIAQGAIFAGAFGIPMVMVSGDEAACAEARDFLGEIATAVVKRGTGWASAELVDFEEAEARIRAAAQEGMAKIKTIAPYCPALPLEIKLTYFRADFCEATLARCPGLERVDARTVRKTVRKVEYYTDILF